MKVTRHTRINNQDEFLQDMATLFCKIEREMHVRIYKDKIDKNKVQKEYTTKYNVNARVCSSVIKSLRQRTEIAKANVKFHKEYLQEKISKLKKKLKKEKNKEKIHQLKRRIYRLKTKLSSLKEGNIIFGGKKLWNKQFSCVTKEEHAAWKEEWFQKRHNQFSLVGNKYESYGNSLCQLIDGVLWVRVPYCLEEKYGKYVQIPVNFKYKAEEIKFAVTNKQPIFYRFVRKNNKWYVFVSYSINQPELISSWKNGCIGIDFNANSIGVVYCDADGNLKHKELLKFNIAGRRSDQITATLSENLKIAVELAKKYKCPIAIENLNFFKKKLEATGKTARMLTYFAYNKFKELLKSKCFKAGIQVKEINPAYSSFIGLVKFMKMYGMDSATAAALVLARRAMYKSERLPTKNTLYVPEDSCKHVWSYWNRFKKKSDAMGLCRHDFFQSIDVNSIAKVNLFHESIARSLAIVEFNGKEELCSSALVDSTEVSPIVSSTTVRLEQVVDYDNAF